MYNILIVDDEPIVKIALRSILPWEEYGFFICGTAGNGLEALSLIEKQHPDVIITDLKMPGMDGLELIRTLKEKKYPGEILVLSNYEDFDSVRSALLLGAADYLLKIKIQADTLLACLNKTTEKLQKKAGEKSPVPEETISENRNRLLLSFFQGDSSLASFIQENRAAELGFMEKSCAICYVTFEKFLSNDAFSISANLLRDMILDAVQGALQPYILVLNDYSALVVFSQKELTVSQIKVEQLVKKLYNRFTMYQSFAPDMPYQENLKNYEEAKKIYQSFHQNEGHYKNDVAKTIAYIEKNYMYRLTLASISANVNLSSSYLCRVFKSEVGTSITSYLNNLRIRKAATLIKEQDLSLKEISAMVGIDDQLYFSRLFKKCMGISPSEYGKKFHQ
ncbi:response regulator transcription factor [Blautia sp.]